MFFSNPPHSNASHYSTLSEVYNIHREIADSEKQHALQTERVRREIADGAKKAALQTERVRRELAQLRDAVSRAATASDAHAERVQAALAKIAQQLASALASPRASPQGARRRRRGSSGSSPEVLQARDYAEP